MKTSILLAAALSLFTFFATAHAPTAKACGSYVRLTPEQQIENVLASHFQRTHYDVETLSLSLDGTQATARVALRRNGVERIRRLELVFTDARWSITRDRLILVRSIARPNRASDPS